MTDRKTDKSATPAATRKGEPLATTTGADQPGPGASPTRDAGANRPPADHAQTRSQPADPYRTRMQVKLLRAAERILEDEGLAQVQARRVAAEAGCSVGTVYNLYGGLDGLILAVNVQTLRMFGRAAQTALKRTSPQTVEPRLLALALAYLDFAVNHSRRWRALFENQLDLTLPTYDLVRTEQAKLYALVETSIGPALEDPVARNSAARALFASTHGIVALAISRSTADEDLAEADRQIRFVVGLFAKALAPSET